MATTTNAIEFVTQAPSDLPADFVPMLQVDREHFVDLRTVAEVEDDPKFQRAFLVHKDKLDTGEPRITMLHGQARARAYAWAAYQAEQAEWALDTLVARHPLPRRRPKTDA